MTAATFVLLAILFLSIGTNGKRIRTPCLQSNHFRCDNEHCIEKNKWCDGSRNCREGSDEKYCRLLNDDHNKNPVVECDDGIHFRCKSGSRCIPVEGYCDGYTSCPDGSDEKDCPCEELFENEGSIEYEAFISSYRTHQKCWKFVVKEDQYLRLEITTNLYKRKCSEGNITVVLDRTKDVERLLCPSNPTRTGSRPSTHSVDENTYTFFEDTLIRYHSGYYVSGSSLKMDFFNITYKKVDALCANPDVFKCNENSCIPPEKECDGIEDCQNGEDEQNCGYGAFSAAYLEASRKKAIKWMKNQHNAEWGWKENSHKAVVALQLAGAMNLNSSNKDDDLIAKQLELEASTFLFRSKIERKSVAELSAYINALLVICHEPRNFYGFDLVTALKDELEELAEYTPPFPYLALCNAKEPISEDAVTELLEIFSDPLDHGFVLEIQALAIMAVTCIINNNNQYVHLKSNVSEALDNLKKEQRQDGSFGNQYTTAIVLQALIANNQEKEKDWNPTSAIKFLIENQEADGSFESFLTTYLILPVLKTKSLLDVGKINCTEDLRRPRDGSRLSDIKSRLQGKNVVKYSLFIGDEKDQIHPIILRTNENITVLELMMLAADIDPKYTFKTHQIKKKKYIYEISHIPNDPESNKFWFIYQGTANGTSLISEQSPDKVEVHKKDDIIMWYKTLDNI